MNNKVSHACCKGFAPKSYSKAHIISQKEMVEHLQKMKAKGDVLTLQFDPLGYLHVNGADQTQPDDFLLYRGGTLYGSIDGTYHCAGKIDEHERTVAVLRGKKFLSERDDGNFTYSSRKVPLSKDICTLVLYKHRDKDELGLMIADGYVCDHVRTISMPDIPANKFLLLSSFFTLLSRHDSRLAVLGQEWYGRPSLVGNCV